MGIALIFLSVSKNKETTVTKRDNTIELIEEDFVLPLDSEDDIDNENSYRMEKAKTYSHLSKDHLGDVFDDPINDNITNLNMSKSGS